jgi:hypothetical protein
MPDYNSILRRSIEGVPSHTADIRRAIYVRARATIARQLTSVTPPLSAESIEAQHQMLEQAIAEVEAEYALDEIDPAEFEAEIGLNAPETAGARVEYEDEDEQEQVRTQAEAFIDYGAPGERPAANQRPVDIRPSRAPMMIVLSLLLLAAGGAAVAGYRYQDQIIAFTDKLSGMAEEMTAAGDTASDAGADTLETADGSTPAEGTLTVASTEDAVAASGKSEERLGEGPGSENVGELRGSEPGVTIQPQTNSVASVQSEGQPAGQSPSGVPAITGASVSSNPDAVQGQSASDTGGSSTLQPDTLVTGAAAPTGTDLGRDTVGTASQRAIFYTQGADDTPGEASEGIVTWSRVQQPDGLPAIQGKINLEKPDIGVIITISKNIDEGLPASHLIEITFEGAQNLSDTVIESIPALVLKPNEQARGQPLSGAGVPVTDSIFWIALSDEAEQVDTNLATLRDGNWFDMPLLFKDKKRALITFEKGGPGEALFKEVLSAWEAS